jgi:SAP domain
MSDLDVKRALLEALDLDALGPTAVAARFTAADLRWFLRGRGLPTSGRKSDLALRLVRALKSSIGVPRSVQVEPG